MSGLISTPVKSRLNLLDLPNETLSIIASHLKIDLYNFILVSQRFKSIGEPFLHRNSTQRVEVGDDGESYNHEDLYSLLRSILRGTQDSAQIKRLRVFAGGADLNISADWAARKDSIFDAQDWVELEKLISKFARQTHPHRIELELEQGRFECAFALVLSLLWNLEVLEISCWNGPGEILERYIECAGIIQSGVGDDLLDLSTALPRLRKVEIRCGLLEGCVTPYTLEIWSNLTSIRALHGDAIGEHAVNEGETEGLFLDELTNLEGEKSNCGVETILLTWSVLSANLMAEFLRQFPRLKNFQYEHGGEAIASAPFEPPRLRRALLEVRHTLEYLRIGNHAGDTYDDLCLLPFGSFKDFTKLKTMNFTFDLLLGTVEIDDDDDGEEYYTYPRYIKLIDALPRNIETLVLTEGTTSAIPHLVELADNLHCFSNLRTLDIELEFEEVEAELGSAFTRIFEDAGVELIIRSTVANDIHLRTDMVE